MNVLIRRITFDMIWSTYCGVIGCTCRVGLLAATYLHLISPSISEFRELRTSNNTTRWPTPSSHVEMAEAFGIVTGVLGLLPLCHGELLRPSKAEIVREYSAHVLYCCLTDDSQMVLG
jgi:hypothetical protein